MKNKNELNEPAISYGFTQSNDVFQLMKIVRNGISFGSFINMIKRIPFSIQEWSLFLHLSERTMQRYQKEEKTFDVTHSERIVQITILYDYGVSVFGNKENFDTWLISKNLVLGSKPKDLLDTVFGIELINTELSRIEHGIFS